MSCVYWRDEWIEFREFLECGFEYRITKLFLNRLLVVLFLLIAGKLEKPGSGFMSSSELLVSCSVLQLAQSARSVFLGEKPCAHHSQRTRTSVESGHRSRLIWRQVQDWVLMLSPFRVSA